MNKFIKKSVFSQYLSKYKTFGVKTFFLMSQHRAQYDVMFKKQIIRQLLEIVVVNKEKDNTVYRLHFFY